MLCTGCVAGSVVEFGVSVWLYEASDCFDVVGGDAELYSRYCAGFGWMMFRFEVGSNLSSLYCMLAKGHVWCADVWQLCTRLLCFPFCADFGRLGSGLR